MGYNKYTDQLLAQQTTIPANKIFTILLGFPPNALIDTKTVKRGSTLADKKKLAKSLALQSIDEKAFRRAKKEEIESWRRQYGKSKGEVRLESKKGNTSPNSPSLVEMEAIYLKKIIATEAHSILKEWMELKFRKDIKEYPCVIFFNWIDSDRVMKKLETQVKGFKTPARVQEFIGYVKQAHTTQKPVTEAHPDTNTAKMKHLHTAYIKKAAEILKTNLLLTGPELVEYSSLKTLIRDSSLPKGKHPKDSNILKHWMPKIRILAKAPSKYGSKTK